MITYFAGLRVVVTDAVYSDHLMVQRGALFCGREAFATIAACDRNPGINEFVLRPLRKSAATKRSVQVERLKPGMAYPVRCAGRTAK